MQGGGEDEEKERPKRPLQKSLVSFFKPAVKVEVKQEQEEVKTEQVEVKVEQVGAKPEQMEMKEEEKVKQEEIEEPPSFAALQSCGAGVNEKCLQTGEPCQKHRLFAEFCKFSQAGAGYTAPKVEAESLQSQGLETPPAKASLVQSPPSGASAHSSSSLLRKGSSGEWTTENMSMSGKIGAEKRKEWIAEQKSLGVKIQHDCPMALKDQERVVKYVLKHMPEEFATTHAAHLWWKEAAEGLELPYAKVKLAWQRRGSLEPALEKAQKKQHFKSRAYVRRYHGEKVKKNRPGAGRKRSLADLEEQLKKDCKTEEKVYGHSLGPDDCMVMWVELLSKRAVELLMKKKELAAKAEELSKKMSRELKSCMDKLKQLPNRKLQNQVKQDMLQAIARTSLKVRRKSTLSRKEEMIRAELSWMDFDRVMWITTLSREELKYYVANSEEFSKNLDKLVIEFEDEIGVWVGLDGSHVAEEQETRQRALKRKKVHTKNLEQDKEAQKKLKALEEAEGGGLEQTRGVEGKSEDKRRITMLHRLLLKDCPQMQTRRVKPHGKMERTVIVLPGKHCNADFIGFDEKGCARWNCDWDYEYDGKTWSYWKGDACGNIMQQVQILKRAFPELVERFLILQQPAAYRDAVIVAWCMKDLHKREPYVMQQHDLLGAQCTAEVKKLRFLLGQVNAILCGDVTAICQLTDIMIAHYVKSDSIQKLKFDFFAIQIIFLLTAMYATPGKAIPVLLESLYVWARWAQWAQWAQIKGKTKLRLSLLVELFGRRR